MALHTIRCAECDDTFESTRSHAETCSSACRKRRARQRTAARDALAIKHAADLLSRQTHEIARLRAVYTPRQEITR